MNKIGLQVRRKCFTSWFECPQTREREVSGSTPEMTAKSVVRKEIHRGYYWFNSN